MLPGVFSRAVVRLVWQNKAFLGPRCVWSGKARVINLFGRFLVKIRYFWFRGAFGVVKQGYLDNCFALWRFVGLPGFSWHSVAASEWFAQWSN